MGIFRGAGDYYKAMISVVTTTTGRPECFALLERWMARQTVRPDQWLCVGEDHNGYKFTQGQQAIRRKPKKSDALHGFLLNWLEAIRHIKGDVVLPMEDDDFFHPEYIATLAPCLDKVRLAGVKGDLYFKLRDRQYQTRGNANHAALTCTGFRREMLPFIERCKLHKSIFIDMFLWAEGTSENNNWTLIPNKATDGLALHVGMKQMPGLAGIGVGHADPGAADPQFAMLTKWIGAADCRAYRDLYKRFWCTP